MATMTIREALAHVWDADGIGLREARGLLRQGEWANGAALDGRELAALAGLANGADPGDHVEVDDEEVE
jgi:hypothetical protein